VKQVLRQQLLAFEILFEGLEEERLLEFCEALDVSGRVFVAGLGRSGCIAESFAARLVRGGRRAHGAFEATAPNLSDGDVLLLVSGSGTTRALEPAIDRARELGVPVLLATANALSPLARRADRLLLLPPVMPPGVSGDDEAILGPMRVFFEQGVLLVLDVMANRLLGPATDRETL
jgi:6-phospho-3-hexuloisomerase